MIQLGEEQPFRLLIHDRDSKLSGGFDEIFRSERVRVIRTPVRVPNAHAYAERWVRTIRADCLDQLLPLAADISSLSFASLACDYLTVETAFLQRI